MCTLSPIFSLQGPVGPIGPKGEPVSLPECDKDEFLGINLLNFISIKQIALHFSAFI